LHPILFYLRPRFAASFLHSKHLLSKEKDMDFEHIEFEIEDGIARIVMNRPEVLNSYNRQMALDVQKALGVCRDDPAVRSIVLTGAGRAFCAGQDLAEVLPKEGGEAIDLAEVVRTCFNPIITQIRSLEKPVIAAVNGVAAGAGANLALACDFVVASEKASFIQSFSQVGLVPDSGGTFMLPRLVGMARATSLMMLAEKVRARDAVEMGMIYRACEPDMLSEEVDGLARRVAGLPTRGLGLTKRLINQAFETDLATQLAAEERDQGEAGRTEDYAEGVAAFLEKRTPHFQGR
jgi:2-(1,2-epoxy-1,2-dihydrophenyl)acetyl-CoA isomerase